MYGKTLLAISLSKYFLLASKMRLKHKQFRHLINLVEQKGAGLGCNKYEWFKLIFEHNGFVVIY